MAMAKMFCELLGWIFLLVYEKQEAGKIIEGRENQIVNYWKLLFKSSAYVCVLCACERERERERERFISLQIHVFLQALSVS